MVRACISCKQRTNKTNPAGVSLYGFPRDDALREKWIAAVGITSNPCESARVCSRHFKEEDFRYSLVGGNRFLKPGAVPSVGLNRESKDACDIKHSNEKDEDDVNTIHIPANRASAFMREDIVITCQDDVSNKFLDIDGNNSSKHIYHIEDSETTRYALKLREHQATTKRHKSIDDVQWEDISTSSAQARIYWEVAVGKIKRQRILIKTLKQKVKRLKAKVTDLRNIIQDLSEKK